MTIAIPAESRLMPALLVSHADEAVTLLELRTVVLNVSGIAWCGETGVDLPSVAALAVPDVGAGAFAVEVRGESMTPEISSGDFAVARPGTPGAGDLVVIERRDGKMLMKRWKAGDGESIELVGNDGVTKLSAAEVAAVSVVHVIVKRVHRRRP